MTQILFSSNAERHGPISCCIYCGKTELRPDSKAKLSAEHVLADGLGGTLILEEASCAQCALATGKIEGFVLRSMFWAPRIQLGIRGKKRKASEDTYPAITVVEGKDVVVRLPIGLHPSILFMAAMYPPRFLRTDIPRDRDIAGFWVHTFKDPTSLFKGGIDQIASPGFDTVRFCQMLAKIAHGYAILKCGLHSFRPLLTDFIVRDFAKAEQFPDCFEYVGGDPNNYSPEMDLHTLGHETFAIKGNSYLIVSIRLFANLGAPVFKVVAGEL